MKSAVPDASRSRTRGWRDPRLVIGVAVIALCVLAGGWLMAGLDDTVGVWSLRRDLPAGSSPTAADLRVEQVRFGDDALADRYLAAATEVPAGATTTRDLAAGELLPRAALGKAAEVAAVEVPLSVQVDDLPATVRVGSLVDVWVVPTQGAQPRAKATKVLADVHVVRLPESDTGLGGQGTRQVIVAVPASGHEAGAELSGAIGAAGSGRVVITRRS